MIHTNYKNNLTTSDVDQQSPTSFNSPIPLIMHLLKKRQVDVIYTDLSKAYDRVNHLILIQKLEPIDLHNNISSWFKSYLSDRVNYVNMYSVLCKPIQVTPGCPRGGLLSAIYLNNFIPKN